jgi:hypothetical protein
MVTKPWYRRWECGAAVVSLGLAATDLNKS